MPILVAYILGFLGALAGTIVLFILVLPDKKRETLPKFMRFLHDLFNFKFLVIEYIMKALYMFATLFCIVSGFFMLFSSLVPGKFVSAAGLGFATMIFGPIFLRVAYEFAMMFILLVKNTNQINRKMPKKDQ